MYNFTITLTKKDKDTTINILAFGIQELLKDLGLLLDLADIKQIAVGEYIIPDNVIQEYKKQGGLDLKQYCPEESQTQDPITAMDFADIPHSEIIFKDNYFSQCYAINTVLNFIVASLEKTRNDSFFPIWPSDPFTLLPFSPQKIINFYKFCMKQNMVIPNIFSVFVMCILNNTIDIKVAMNGPYIGLTDRINPKYIDLFVTPFKTQLGSQDESNPAHGFTEGGTTLMETILDSIDFLPALLF